MSGDRLSPLQRRILRVLADLAPPWTLSGGGALIGFHIGHRQTRDLDLFWRNRGELGTLAAEVLDRLHAEGLEGRTLRTERSFGLSAEQAEVLSSFKDWLIDRVTRSAAPE